jgi:hypothetical protein
MICSAKILVFNRWVIAVVDDEIGRYYRSLYSLEYFYKPRINKPLWGTHCTIIRGEIVLPDWVKYEYHETELEIYYCNHMQTNGVHFWLPVRCEEFDYLRNELDIGPPTCAYHLSIGNICNGTGQTIPEDYR